MGATTDAQTDDYCRKPGFKNALERLTKLQILELSRNKVSDINILPKLHQLYAIDLSHNQISDIPETVLNRDIQIDISSKYFSSAVFHINLYNNPIRTPAPEILEQGRKAIINYLNNKN